MGRLDREPRPSREELESTLKFVAETDNLDGDVYTLAREVIALREELAQRYATVDAAWKDANRVNALVKAAGGLLSRAEPDVSDTVAYTKNADLSALRAALKPFEE